MCQAYEGERASICAGEDHNTHMGFVAAATGKRLEDNPNYKGGLYDRKAWFHGFACWMVGLVPWCVERDLIYSWAEQSGSDKYKIKQDISREFNKNGKLPEWLLLKLTIPADSISPLQRDFSTPDVDEERRQMYK